MNKSLNIIKQNLTEIEVTYLNFYDETKIGTIVCNNKISNDLKEIFNELYKIKFPIFQINPIEKFDNDDYKSVLANNTSCFNYRQVIGSNSLSDHSTGNAIDINPFQNPWIHPNAHKIPGRKYDISQKGTITEEVVDVFKKYRWSWGGNWKNPDYQHFYKPNNDLKNKLLRFNENILSYRDFKKIYE